MRRWTAALLSALLFGAACGPARPPAQPGPATAEARAPSAARPTIAVFPGEDWERIADPKSSGYCEDRFDLITTRLKGLPTTAMMVVVGGRVLYQYGDVQRVSYIASVRKSVLAMLYGNYVASGKIRLNKTLADL